MNSKQVPLVLDSGNWVVEPILNQLNTQLKKAVSDSTFCSSITSLCLSYYKKTPASSVKLDSKSKGIFDLTTSDSTASLLMSCFVQEHPEAVIRATFSMEESRMIEAALGVIKENDLGLYRLITENIAFFIKVQGAVFRSASHPHMLGSILLSDRINTMDAPQLAVSIVHEFAHQELFLLNFLDRLVVSGFEYNEIHAPFQGRKRPPIGRLHSLWALFRMVQFERKAGLPYERHTQLLIENSKAFEHGELTDFAQYLVHLSTKQVA